MGRTDAELITACKAGDTAAFGMVVERYQRAVVAVAYAAVRDRVLAEDVAQDAFVTAWTKLASLRDAERLPAWLCGIARNVARARRRVRGREVGETDAAGETTPYTSLDDAQREAAVAAALARVPLPYREPLVLVYCEAQSAKDVARALGTSDAAVHQRLSRGRALLARDAELVEHAGSRSRRDLAAAVLAAIALGVGSSRVEASPRGLPMLKLTAIALTASLAAGTTYVVARGTQSSPQAAPKTARSHAPAPQARFPLFGAPHASAAPHAAPRPAGAAAITCTEVASHMTTMAFANVTDLPMDGSAHDDALAYVQSHFEDSCERGEWTQDYMACVLGAPDSYSMMLDCASYKNPTLFDDVPETAEFGDSEVVIPSRTEPLAPTTDSSCAGIAKHMGELSMPDAASLAKLPAPKRAQLEPAIAGAQRQMVAQVEKSCVDTEWPDARRTCLAAATTTTEMMACQ
jgi:RNA polymerase sigma factor (sigma-70 family)